MLLCANLKDISQWTSETIDHILIEGDVMYLQAIQNNAIHDEDVIALNYLPDRIVLFADEVYKQNQFHDETKLHNQSLNEANKRIESPIMVSNTDLPIMVEAYESNQSPDKANKRDNQSPGEANKRNKLHSTHLPTEAIKSNQSLSTVKNNMLNIPEMLEAKSATNLVWSVYYKEFCQGRIITEEHENELPYTDLNSALIYYFF